MAAVIEGKLKESTLDGALLSVKQLERRSRPVEGTDDVVDLDERKEALHNVQLKGQNDFRCSSGSSAHTLTRSRLPKSASLSLSQLLMTLSVSGLHKYSVHFALKAGATSRSASNAIASTLFAKISLA